MSILQVRRGLEVNRTNITPAEGELIYTTDQKQLYVGDGTTLGGTGISQSAASILASIKTVDGIGSGLDSDLLQGIPVGDAVTNNFTHIPVIKSNFGGIMEVGRYIDFHHNIGNLANFNTRISTNGVNDGELFINDVNKIWHSGNDGPGSGLNADLVQSMPVSSNAGANTIMARNPFGYVYANFFNTTPNTVSSGLTISNICIETDNDGFIRHGTANAIREFLNVEDGATKVSTGNKTVSFILKSGHNLGSLLINDKLYVTSGTIGSYDNIGVGKGGNNTNPYYGTDNFKELSIPSSSPIIKTGGNGHAVTFALLLNGELYTWGLNSRGACGLGHTVPVGIPTLAATGVVDVYDTGENNGFSVADARLIIKKSDGFLYGCGYDNFGALGIGSVAVNRPSFVQLTAFGSGIKSAWNMGCTHGCLVVQKNDDTIWISGYNGWGQFGDGSIVSTSNPINVTTQWGGGTGFVLKQVIGGFGYNSGTILTDSSLGMLLDNGITTIFKLSGNNINNQLGDTTTINKTTPVTPNVGAGRIAKVAFVAALGPVQCLKEDNNLYAWGRALEGALGDGTNILRSVPTIVQTNVIDIYSNGMDSHLFGYVGRAYIKKIDGQLYAAGENSAGYLGDGTIINRNSFVRVLLPNNIDIQDLGSFTTDSHGRILIAKGINNKLYSWGYNLNFGVTDSSTITARTPNQIKITEDNV